MIVWCQKVYTLVISTNNSSKVNNSKEFSVNIAFNNIVILFVVLINIGLVDNMWCDVVKFFFGSRSK